MSAPPPSSYYGYAGYSTAGNSGNYASYGYSAGPTAYAGSYQSYAQAQNYAQPPARGRQPGSYPAYGSFPGDSSNSTPLGQRGGEDNRKRRFGDPGSEQFNKKPRMTSGFSKNPHDKDDSLIKVDPTLIDKKFNFWNLPKSAKILLVSNVPKEIAKPRPLFHLFSFYGDVHRVKILPHKPNVALVEFATATMACIARNHLDQVEMKEHKLVVSFSRFGEIRMTSDEHSEDFTAREFQNLHRFCKDELMSVNLKRISRPTCCLHINNMPVGVTPRHIKDLFQGKAGILVTDIIGVKKLKDKSTPGGLSRGMVFVQVNNVSDALVGMSLVGGCWASAEIPAGLRVSFTDSDVGKERTKYESDKKIQVMDMDQPL